MEAATNLQKIIDKTLPESTAKMRLETTRDQILQAFVFRLEEWTETALDSMQEESKLLLKELNKHPTKTKDYLRQLSALHSQQQKLCNELNKLAREAPTPNLQKVLKEATVAIKKEQEALNKTLTTHTEVASLLPLDYGSEEWMVLVAQRPERTRSSVEQMIHTFTHPETWSSSTKAIVHTLLVGMQLGQQAIGIAAQLNQAQLLREQAEQMQKKLPVETQQAIERDTAFLRNTPNG